MGKNNKPVQEKAKEELAELLEIDAQEIQAETMETETEEQVHESIAPAASEDRKPMQKTTRDIAASFLPTKKGKVMGAGTSADGISHNSVMLNWPTDTWGLTKDLKAALIHVASRIAGAEDKKALVDEVLRVGLGHLEMKFKRDNAARKEAQAKSEKGE